MAAMAVGLPARGEAEKPAAKNILFVVVDDLRPQMNCYGREGMATPHLNRLAAGGTLFERAYSQYPVCGPSRASMISGLRPTVDRYRKWDARVEADCPEVLTLPEHVKRHGYASVTLGKVLHHQDDCEGAWSCRPWFPRDAFGAGAFLAEENRAVLRESGRVPAFERVAAEDGAYGDGRIAARAIDELRRLKAEGNPFFLAVGFLKPHLPFVAPEKYWSLYDREGLALAAHPGPPRHAPKEALHQWEELRKYAGMPKTGPLDGEVARTLVHGYCAGVSYMDAQLGAVLNELERLGLRESTLVVLCADHGWQLGEHGLWAKHCLFETSLHIPLIFHGPGVPAGKRVKGLVENLDIYPTLCEWAGLPVPGHVEGRSLVPHFGAGDAPGKEAVFSRQALSDSIKTDRYRYSEFRNPQGQATARMLYDHEADPDENINIAEDPAQQKTVAQLAEKLGLMIAGKPVG